MFVGSPEKGVPLQSKAFQNYTLLIRLQVHRPMKTPNNEKYFSPHLSLWLEGDYDLRRICQRDLWGHMVV